MLNLVRIKWEMKKYARTHGVAVPDGFNPIKPIWGKPARGLAWRVTSHAKSKHGYTGPVSTQPEFAKALLFPVPMRTRAIRAARKEVGVHEVPSGSNYGPRVKEYQATTGMYRQPWCASFVAWDYREAGYNGRLPASPAWVPAWSAAATTRNPSTFKKVAKIALKPGDFVTLWGNKHIELFDRWIIPGILAQCIGGNTSVVGKDNNGGAVCRTRRYVSEITTAGRVG
jgi:hypothetical protein